MEREQTERRPAILPSNDFLLVARGSVPPPSPPPSIYVHGRAGARCTSVRDSTLSGMNIPIVNGAARVSLMDAVIRSPRMFSRCASLRCVPDEFGARCSFDTRRACAERAAHAQRPKRLPISSAIPRASLNVTGTSRLEELLMLLLRARVPLPPRAVHGAACCARG